MQLRYGLLSIVVKNRIYGRCRHPLTYDWLLVSNEGTHTWRLVGQTELSQTPLRVHIRPHGHPQKTNLSQTVEEKLNYTVKSCSVEIGGGCHIKSEVTLTVANAYNRNGEYATKRGGLRLFVVGHIPLYLDFLLRLWSLTANMCTVPLSLEQQRKAESKLKLRLQRWWRKNGHANDNYNTGLFSRH